MFSKSHDKLKKYLLVAVTSWAKSAESMPFSSANFLAVWTIKAGSQGHLLRTGSGEI